MVGVSVPSAMTPFTRAGTCCGFPVRASATVPSCTYWRALSLTAVSSVAGSSAPVSHVPSMMGAGMILVRSASVMMMVTRRISVLRHRTTPYGEVVEVILRRCDSRTEMREAFLQSRDDLYVHR